MRDWQLAYHNLESRIVPMEAASLTIGSVSSSGNIGAYTSELVNAASGNLARALPSPVLNACYRVMKTDVSVHTVTITPHASEKINGASSIVLYDQYEFVRLVSDGTNWYIN